MLACCKTAPGAMTGVSTFKAKECADQALLACRWSTCRRLCGAASATKAACSAWVARWRAGRRRDGRVYRIAPPLPSTNGAAAARRAPIGATAVGAAAAGAHATSACHQHPATSGWPPAMATERHLPFQNCVGSARRFAQVLPICNWPRTGSATRNWIVEEHANLVRMSMNAHPEHLARRLTNDYELLQASSQDRRHPAFPRAARITTAHA